MRILFLSAFYPPAVIGGWEQLVEDINQRLQQRGHLTQVLTSAYSADGSLPAGETGVWRWLELESDLVHYGGGGSLAPLGEFFLRRPRRLQRNLAAVRRAVAEFQPDVIFIHVMFNLARQLAWLAEQLMPGRVVYYVANDWPFAPDVHSAYWRDPAQGLFKRALKGAAGWAALRALQAEARRTPLRFERLLCVSQALRRELHRQAGIPLEQMRVVYNGVETDLFTPPAAEGEPRACLEAVYAGSLVPHKGVHTAVEAFAALKGRRLARPLRLTLIGGGHPEYEARLRALVAAHGLEGQVVFAGRVPRAEMPARLRSFDVLIFPSIWEEPLARVVQEAMACGLAVIGTLTGGSGEILFEGETALTFAPGDAAGLAAGLERLAGDPALRRRLAENGRALVLRQFDLQRMIDEIEASLLACLNQT